MNELKFYFFNPHHRMYMLYDSDLLTCWTIDIVYELLVSQQEKSPRYGIFLKFAFLSVLR